MTEILFEQFWIEPGKFITPRNASNGYVMPLELDLATQALEAFGCLEIKTFLTGWYIENLTNQPVQVGLRYKLDPVLDATP